MREGHGDPLILKNLTMIDFTTRGFKIVQYNYKQADTITNVIPEGVILL